MVKISVPTTLKSKSGAFVELEDDVKIGELLLSIRNKFPQLADEILVKNNELKRFVKVFINGEDIAFHDPQYDLSQRDEVSIICAIAGG